MTRRRLVTGVLFLTAVVVLGWTYVQNLVPAVHPEHDHGLENIAGGGFLRVESVEGGRRNLVGRPKGVLVLHWFALGAELTRAEVPLLVDYMRSAEADSGIDVVMIVVGSTRKQVLAWAKEFAVPTKSLYVDPAKKTARLMGVHKTPETLIYDSAGHLVHQARGPIDWSDADTRKAIAANKQGGGEHRH